MERCMRVGRLVRALDNPYEDVHSSANFEKIVHISLLCDWNEVDELDLLQN